SAAGKPPPENTPKSQKPAAVKKDRSPAQAERDELFDAVCKVAGADPVLAGGRVGKVVTALLKAKPPYTPAEVLQVPAAVAAAGMEFTFTVECIPKYVSW